jgi:hypothetical protein
LQGYPALGKVYAINAGAINNFDQENYLRFFIENIMIFMKVLKIETDEGFGNCLGFFR